MNVIDLSVQDSFNYPMDYCRADLQQESLFMGHQKSIYLFFRFPSCLCASILLQARLFLFKLPSHTGICTEKPAERYTLYPLLEVFNCFNFLFSPPALDYSRSIPFENRPCRSYTEIDLTQLVRDWAGNKLENNGLLLTGEADSPYVFYASGSYKIQRMRPLLRLTFQDTEAFCALDSVPCEVEVSRRS